ncbi:craniofacial development protein 1-like [Glandiceps talaboti]
MSDSEEDYSSEEDEDYVPSAEESDEEDIVQEDSEGTVAVKAQKKGKNKDESRKRKGGIQLDEEDDKIAKEEREEEEARKLELSKEIQKEQEKKKEEEEKKKADDLWASFLSDVDPPAKPKPKTSVSSSTSQQSISQVDKSDGSRSVNAKEKKDETSKETEKKLTVTKVFDFAGEEVKVTEQVDVNSKEGKAYLKQKEAEKESQKETEKGQSSGISKPTIVSRLGSGVPGLKRPRGGLSGVLGKINKKPKMSTLQKSHLDWKSFKEDEGIEEELTQHNKGKEGYLEKQAFLERTDVRQYEMEKTVRLGVNKGKR